MPPISILVSQVDTGVTQFTPLHIHVALVIDLAKFYFGDLDSGQLIRIAGKHSKSGLRYW